MTNSLEWRPAPAPATHDLAVLRRAAKKCTACPLHRHATQTVFGEGASDASLVLVGEQPGDAEDRTGQPFVGPAGKLLDRALEEAGIDRSATYVTNAVKHFKWEPAGKRRIHRKPGARDMAACRPWLEGELRIVRPRVLCASAERPHSPWWAGRRGCSATAARFSSRTSARAR